MCSSIPGQVPTFLVCCCIGMDLKAVTLSSTNEARNMTAMSRHSEVDPIGVRLTSALLRQLFGQQPARAKVERRPSSHNRDSVVSPSGRKGFQRDDPPHSIPRREGWRYPEVFNVQCWRPSRYCTVDGKETAVLYRQQDGAVRTSRREKQNLHLEGILVYVYIHKIQVKTKGVMMFIFTTVVREPVYFTVPTPRKFYGLQTRPRKSTSDVGHWRPLLDELLVCFSAPLLPIEL